MNECLLIVSAAPELRELVRASFEDEYEVHEADNGKFGLRMALAIRPAVIFIDESLPGDPDGAFLHELLKANAGLAGTRLVLLNTTRHPWPCTPAATTERYGVMDIVGRITPLALAA